MTDGTFFTTEQAATQIGTSHMALLVWINRHPEYAPKLQMGKGALVWTQADIERAKAGREVTKRWPNKNHA
jgi:hypothetical protein